MGESRRCNPAEKIWIRLTGLCETQRRFSVWLLILAIEKMVMQLNCVVAAYARAPLPGARNEIQGPISGGRLVILAANHRSAFSFSGKAGARI